MKTIVKLLERMMPKLEYVGNFGTEVYNGTWTAPADGILLAHGQWNNSGTAAYWQITDQTDNHMVMSMATTNANQHQWEFGIPVLKGHEYYTSSAMALKAANAYFYRLTWGGYCITSFISTVLSHLAERWWEYEDPEENPRQNATELWTTWGRGRSCNLVRSANPVGVKHTSRFIGTRPNMGYDFQPTVCLHSSSFRSGGRNNRRKYVFCGSNKYHKNRVQIYKALNGINILQLSNCLVGNRQSTVALERGCC